MEEQERTITLDLGSSPDPLIDPVLSPPMMAPPSTIKKRTPAAERLLTARSAQTLRTAYGPSTVTRTPLAPTPRRQTFELDVGDEDAPQRLLVTVEAEADPRSAPRSTSRRLFQSPTPKNHRLTPRRTTAVTTTTVPLRGLSDDEDGTASRPIGTTPRPRGRPRKSATPATTRRKRPGTPAKRSTSTANAFTSSPSKHVPESDAGFEATPRPRAKTTKRKASSPVKEDGVPGSQPRKRGRPRKKTMDTDDAAEQARQSRFASTAEEDDIWLATMSDQPTPALPARGQPVATESQTSPIRDAEPDSYDWPDMGAGGGDSYSDAGSVSGDGDGFEDTVMAEEFTMISLGSLPSMQPNSSVMAPTHQEELGEETSLIINGALESLRRSQNAMPEQSGHSEHNTEAETERATATTEAPTPNDSRTKPPRLDPPSSPQRRRQSPRRSPRRTASQPLARQLAEKSLQQQQQQQEQNRQPVPQPPVQDEHQDASAYDDSFSSIPEAILAAATPRPLRQQFRTQEPDARIQPSIERPSRVNHSNPQPETNRLLTPDETPSPIPSEAGDDAHHDHDHNHDDANLEPEPEPEAEPEPEPEPQRADALETDHLPSSSPPVVNTQPRIPDMTTTQQHIRRNSTETPVDQLSLFTSVNPTAGVVRDAQPAAAAAAAAAVHLPVPEPQPRPSLSPIVRAGRALQLITSDPPSPPARDSFLGSPFRGSSVPKSSQSPAQMPAVPEHGRPNLSPAATAAAAVQPRTDVLTRSPSRSWLAPLSQVKDFIVRSAQSLSPGRVSVVSGAEGMDDPFGPDPGEVGGEVSVRNTLFTGARRQSWERGVEGVRDDNDHDGVHDHDGQREEEEEDAMSWQVERSPARVQPAGGVDEVAHGVVQESPRGQSGGYEQQTMWPASGFSPGTSRPLAGSAVPEEVHEDFHEQQQQQQQEEDEEEEEDDDDDVDIWAIEAQRPTPYTSRHAPLRLEPAVEPPRRTKISSPWRRDSRNPRYSEEMGEPSDKAAPAHGRTAVEESRNTKPSPIQVRPLRQRPLRSDRSLLANDDEEFSLLSQNQKRDKPAPSPAVTRPAAQKKDLAAFFSSPATLPDLTEPPFPTNVLPSQQTRPAPQPRTSRVQTLRTQATGSGGGLFSQYLQERAEKQVPSVPHKTLEIGTRRRSVDLFSPERQSAERRSPEAERASLSRSASPEVPELRQAPVNQNAVAVAQQPGIARRTASPESPDQQQEVAISPPHIPQKMNFTPRKRSDENTLLSPPKPAAPAPAPTASLFGNSQVTAFFSRALSRVKQQQQPPQVESSPPLRAAERREEDGGAETENETTQASTPPRRVLKPLPDRAASPTKSSFRSPLKPKTPGRVVEFASSVFSQPGQGQEGQQRRRRRQDWNEDEEEEEESGRHQVGGSGGHGDEDMSPLPSPSPSASLSLSMSSPSTPPSPSPSPSRTRARSRSGSLPTAAEAEDHEQDTHLADQHDQQQQQQQQQQGKQAITQPPSILTQQQHLPRPLKPAASHKDKPHKTAHQPLSPTTWTRAHWLRLDELLQARRRGPASFRIELARGPLPPSSLYSLSPFRSRNRNQEEEDGQGRLARRLVGKQVVAQGFSETVTLEGWHVEVVEGFLRELRYYGEGEGEDCAWNGVDIARRVFALLVGAERRRLGLVPVVRDMGVGRV
ncbi:hypothetical protein VTJ49DRAFT_7073 [Mycothermus thermophilus]|uniref:Uncharacterized protein n=1 Tax=Humicola insolens TaxID=85995 RepID=A0ABR3VKG2_HUMIN